VRNNVCARVRAIVRSSRQHCLSAAAGRPIPVSVVALIAEKAAGSDEIRDILERGYHLLEPDDFTVLLAYPGTTEDLERMIRRLRGW